MAKSSTSSRSNKCAPIDPALLGQVASPIRAQALEPRLLLDGAALSSAVDALDTDNATLNTATIPAATPAVAPWMDRRSPQEAGEGSDEPGPVAKDGAVNNVTSTPVLDANGSSPGTGHEATYVEQRTPAPIVDLSVEISDLEQDIVGAWIQLNGLQGDTLNTDSVVLG